MTEDELTAIETSNTRAHQMVSDLCQGRREWIMRIPADPTYDPDLVIGASLRDVAALVAELRAARVWQDRQRDSPA